MMGQQVFDKIGAVPVRSVNGIGTNILIKTVKKKGFTGLFIIQSKALCLFFRKVDCLLILSISSKSITP